MADGTAISKARSIAFAVAFPIQMCQVASTAGTGETRDTQQLIGDTGQRQDHDHGNYALALTHMVPDNAGYAPDMFPTTDRHSSKF
jgi:hypothetical protein